MKNIPVRKPSVISKIAHSGEPNCRFALRALCARYGIPTPIAEAQEEISIIITDEEICKHLEAEKKTDKVSYRTIVEDAIEKFNA